MKKTIPEINFNEEKNCFDKIVSHLEKHENICFVSGAGSGKTYALVETIRYLLITKHEDLQRNNQKIVCITYTNAAADEVKRRLGENSLVVVSTIHDRLWDLIRPYESEIDKCHNEKICNEIEKEKEKLKSSSFSKLEEFGYLIPELSAKKDEIYQYIRLGAAEARIKVTEALDLEDKQADLVKNMGNFSKWFKAHMRLENLKSCLEKIQDGREQNHAQYDARRNTDQLHKMRFSHDTLLEYSDELVSQYPRLAQLIIDKYPYFLIDEYQDTAPHVLHLVRMLVEKSKECRHDFWLGLYGDPVQKIYFHRSDCDERIDDLALEKIYKPFNRRSSNQIIEIANKIRNIPEEDQRSIYENYDSRINPVFYYTKETQEQTVNQLTDDFINWAKARFSIDSVNRLHVFVLTNSYIAQVLGIQNIYDFFKKAPFYTGDKYNLLNQELLSTDISKLGRVQLCLFRMIEFCYRIKNADGNTLASELFPLDFLKSFKISEFFTLVKTCQNCLRDNLSATVAAFQKEADSNKTNVGVCIANILKQTWELDCQFSDASVTDFIACSLGFELEEMNKVADFLNIGMDEFYKWYEHVGSVDSNREVVYHTWHSTKGLEFQNVVIVMDPSFGKDRNLFSYFFSEYNLQSCELDSQKFQEARNLLYVAVTRAMENLAIFYRGDLGKSEETIMSIFGSCEVFLSEGC